MAHCGACHETFSGTGLFDKHRGQHGERGRCLDPREIRHLAGHEIMFHRGGMWRGPEVDEAERARIAVRTHRAPRRATKPGGSVESGGQALPAP